MKATKATGQQQQQQQGSPSQQTSLDQRYGKIGISAVAAAVRHKGEQQRAKTGTRFSATDSD